MALCGFPKGDPTTYGPIIGYSETSNVVYVRGLLVNMYRTSVLWVYLGVSLHVFPRRS